MTIAELRRTIAQADARNDQLLGYSSRFMIQYKFALPLACCVLALIALALGVSHRKDGMLASFVIGISVSFVYYVLLYMARASAFGGVLNPTWRRGFRNAGAGRRSASRCCSGGRARPIVRS